ncbi:MAG: type II toxin-antitoxin system RelE/ParE family toxin [Mariniphaga sp.]
MGTVVWTSLIIDDIKSIHTYIALESRVYVNRTIGKIISRVNQLQRFPESGKIVPEFG